jgi:malonyl-CoA O-methyltransferase
MQADERRRVREAFDAAAVVYDEGADIQREIAAALAARTGARLRCDGLIVDAGCGTGGLGLHLAAKQLPQVLGVDLAPAMASIASTRYGKTLCGDIETLPLANACADLYWSSLAWQWCDAVRTAREAARVLRPGGAALVASLGPDTLAELRAAFAQIDGAEHVRRFESPEALEAAFRAAGFSNVVLTRETHVRYSATLPDLLRGIRAIGAHTLGGGRRRGLLGKAAWTTLARSYEAHRDAKGLPARYDVLLILATR